MDRWTDGKMDRWTDILRDRLMGEQTGEEKDGRIKTQMNGRMCRWMNR
jgi:hypothetical protein